MNEAKPKKSPSLLTGPDTKPIGPGPYYDGDSYSLAYNGDDSNDEFDFNPGANEDVEHPLDEDTPVTQDTVSDNEWEIAAEKKTEIEPGNVTEYQGQNADEEENADEDGEFDCSLCELDSEDEWVVWDADGFHTRLVKFDPPPSAQPTQPGFPGRSDGWGFNDALNTSTSTSPFGNEFKGIGSRVTVDVSLFLFSFFAFISTLLISLLD